MSSILPRHVNLRLSNLSPKPSAKGVEVDSVRTRYVLDENGKPTSQVDQFVLDFIAIKSNIQSVKIPYNPETEAKIKRIADALKADSSIFVNFTNFKARFYCMKRGDEIIQGITASADDVEIISIDAPELDDFDTIIE